MIGVPENLTLCADYPVKLQDFEGPLDLLLYLIKKNELDIHHIPIAQITTQYLDILNSVDQDKLTVAGEFFVMTATLMLIKSRMLLPQQADIEENDLLEGEKPGEDPRWALVEQLLEYKKFKEAAASLETCLCYHIDHLPRLVAVQPLLESRPLQPGCSVTISNVFQSVCLRLKERLNLHVLQEDPVTIADQIQWVLSYMIDKPVFQFGEFWAQPVSKSIIAATFLAILELSRLNELLIHQENGPFEPIFCEKTKQSTLVQLCDASACLS